MTWNDGHEKIISFAVQSERGIFPSVVKVISDPIELAKKEDEVEEESSHRVNVFVWEGNKEEVEEINDFCSKIGMYEIPMVKEKVRPNPHLHPKVNPQYN